MPAYKKAKTPVYKRARRTVTTEGEPAMAKFKEGLSYSEVKEIVQKELSDEIEYKHCITEYSSIPINAAIPFGTVLNGQGNFFKLMPQIVQSNPGASGRAYNNRVGNEITLKHLDVDMFLDYPPQLVNNLTADPQNQKLAVRVMILRAKEINDQELLFDNMPTDTLVRFGNQTGGVSGPTFFGGLPLDSVREINRDTFAVRYDKVHYINAGQSIFPGTTNPDVAVNPSGLKMIQHRLKFGKKGLKLKYSAKVDEQPNNFPYFMVIGYSSMSANAVPSNGLIQATVNITGAYTDA